MIQAFILFAALYGNQNPVVTTYKVNIAESVVEWKGDKVIGDSHEGILKFQSGTIEVEDGAVTGGSFIVDMKTLENKDLSGNMKAKLEGHLTSDDFFGVEKYPTSKLVIKSVNKDNSGAVTITADLTIKENTETIEFPALVKMEGDVMLATANLTFDRSKFNVRYGSDSFFDNLGDKAISDEIVLNVKIKAAL